ISARPVPWPRPASVTRTSSTQPTARRRRTSGAGTPAGSRSGPPRCPRPAGRRPARPAERGSWRRTPRGRTGTTGPGPRPARQPGPGPRGPRRGSRVAVGGDLHVVGEHDRPVGQLAPVDGLELADRGRLAVRLVGRLVGELEEVHEPGGVVLALPRGVHP